MNDELVNELQNIIYWADLVGIGVFAISGALLAHRKHLDGFGVLVLASLTAIGGGTLRDLLLDIPVFWTRDHSAFYAIGIASVLSVIVLRSYGRMPKRVLITADALGLALFVIMGTQKALDQDVSFLVAIVMGTFTGVAGGMLRDVLVQDTPMILKQELYATACIAGSGLYIVLLEAELNPLYAAAISMVFLFSLRLAAVQWHWGIPVFNNNDPYQDQSKPLPRSQQQANKKKAESKHD